MASSAPKRPRLENNPENVAVFYAPQKLVKVRIKGMQNAMKKIGIAVVDSQRDHFTHLVTGFDNEEDVWRTLGRKSMDGEQIAVVSVDWHADCIKAGRLISPEKYLLPKMKIHNPTEALEILEEEANLRNSDNDYSRALAFRNCSSVLKSLTFQVIDIGQIKHQKDIGKGHCMKVIRNIIDKGFSEEVENIKENEWFLSMRAFVSVFGVGPGIGNRWFSQGLRSIDDVKNNIDIQNRHDSRLATGIAYHEDLAMPVQRCEAEAWRHLIQTEVDKIAPGTTVEITGGFRRGKSTGHDIDLLISHLEEGKEQGVLTRLMKRLHHLGIVIYGRYEKSTYSTRVLQYDSKHTPLKSTLDHFEKWIGVVRMNKLLTSNHKLPEGEISQFIPQSLEGLTRIASEVTCSDSLETPSEIFTIKEAMESVPSDRDWVARRVDLIIAPAHQYYYALVGWTGSKHFNRSARRYALNEHNLKLSSHGLWDINQGKSLTATSERQVFDNLKLPYREPHDRNS